MKTLILVSILVGFSAFAAKSYQVTGPVLAVGANSITVEKGKDKWEIATNATTKGTAKVGDKVTVYYSMTAEEIEVKGASAAKKKK